MNIPATAATLSNHIWDELQPGQTASITHCVTERDLYLFAHASGNLNPMHMPSTEANGNAPVAPALWIGSLVSKVLGNLLPGPGTLYLAQNFEFKERAHIGDKLQVRVTVAEKLQCPQVEFDTEVCREDGCVIAQGRARVQAPQERILTAQADLPAVVIDTEDHFARLFEAAGKLEPMPTAVVWPDDANSLGGALLSAQRGLIVPILIGPKLRIEAAAQEGGHSLEGVTIIDAPHPSQAAARAVAMVHEDRVHAIMKGNIHSDELLAHVVRRESGLRTGRRISHVFALDVPTLSHMLFISDAAINILPDLATKADIVQNAIDLGRACGLVQPRVGVLSAVETVNLSIPSSMDAAILAKMAERGQITGGIVDGPLAMDNAINMGAARSKKLVSQVAGLAQILIVPNLEAGNMLAKQLTFVSGAEPAGLVLGAKVPIMLTSRADNDHARMASCALAQLYAYFCRTGQSAAPAMMAASV